MTLGYVHEIIHEGKVVEVEDPGSVACVVNNTSLDVEDGSFKPGSTSGPA
jgi:hypothetical protein